MIAQTTSRIAAQRTSDVDRCETCTRAATRLYDAEVALHHAHQTAVDSWIAAAADRLHEAIVAHRAALALHQFVAEPAAS